MIRLILFLMGVGFWAFMQFGGSLPEATKAAMNKAAEKHKRGLMSYGEYSRMLTGEKEK